MLLLHKLFLWGIFWALLLSLFFVFLLSVASFNLLFFLGLNRTTSFLNFTFLVSLFFISSFLSRNFKGVSVWLCSLTTPSNLAFLTYRVSFLAFFSSLIITVIEVTGKSIRPVSLTCRLRANISARHLLSAIFFSAGAPVLLTSFLLTRYYAFEVRISLIQRFVYGFLVTWL